MLHRSSFTPPVHRDNELMSPERARQVFDRIENISLLLWISGEYNHHPPTALIVGIIHAYCVSLERQARLCGGCGSVSVPMCQSLAGSGSSDLAVQ